MSSKTGDEASGGVRAGGVQRQLLPDGLTDLPAGPRLAAALAGVDLTRLTSADVLTVLVVQDRQVAHEQAVMLAVLLEASYAGFGADPGVVSRDEKIDEFASDQVALNLRWSHVRATGQIGLAQSLIEELPAVYAALLAGHIDVAKARCFVHGLEFLSKDKARALADQLLVGAPTATLAQLESRIRYWVDKIDPGAARRRQTQSVADRYMYTELDHNGTATLAGRNLPPDRAAAAAERVERLARAAKADGDVRNLNQLRADAMVALLAGVPFQLQPPTDKHTAQADADAREADEQFIRHAAANKHMADTNAKLKATRQAAAQQAAAEQQAAEQAAAQQQAAERAAAQRAADEQAAAGFEVGLPDADTPDPSPPDLEPDAGPGFQLSEVFDPIGAAGLTDDPLPVRAADGRIDLDRTPMSDRANVCVCGGVQPAFRRGVVDLQLKLSTLMCLDDDPALLPGWGPVIADIARQVALDQQTNPAWKWSVTDEQGRLLHHGHTGRRPTADEEAFVKARDGTCTMPGCRKPAKHCDVDHRPEHVKGGVSHRGGLQVLCRRHHRMRHERGFVSEAISANTYLWDAPNKRIYIATPEGNLIQTGENVEPGPPPGYVRRIFDLPDHDDD